MSDSSPCRAGPGRTQLAGATRGGADAAQPIVTERDWAGGRVVAERHVVQLDGEAVGRDGEEGEPLPLRVPRAEQVVQPATRRDGGDHLTVRHRGGGVWGCG